MATTEFYSWVGKSLIVDGSTFFTFYGQDFNPNVPSLPSSWDINTTYASWETSYNLNWFSVGNEVCCGAFILSNDDPNNSVYASWDMYFEKSYDGVNYHSAWWGDSSWLEIPADKSLLQYYYVWVDEDEIWIWETYYRFHIERSSTDGSGDYIDIPFTISNLSFDDSLHKSGYLWVEWRYLCYTDATQWSSWYKHKINYDSGYSGGSWDAGYIWIPDGEPGLIYYTDAYGTVRRTHFASSWYWGSRSWTKWYIYVSNWTTPANWYGYLCFVDGMGKLMRMWNGEP